jgi:hypothetical protein
MAQSMRTRSAPLRDDPADRGPEGAHLLGQEAAPVVAVARGAAGGLVAEELDLTGAQRGQVVGAGFECGQCVTGDDDVHPGGDALGDEEADRALGEGAAVEAAHPLVGLADAVVADVDLGEGAELPGLRFVEADAAGGEDGDEAEAAGVRGDLAEIGAGEGLASAEGHGGDAGGAGLDEALDDRGERGRVAVGAGVEVAALARGGAAGGDGEVELEGASRARDAVAVRDAEALGERGVDGDAAWRRRGAPRRRRARGATR